MLKKLASLLFEEEEEIVEEDLDIKEEPIKKEKSFISTKSPKPVEKVEEKIVDEPIFRPEEKVEVKEVEEIIRPIKSNFGIAFDEPTPIKEKPKLMKEKPIYEFKPVISPMFGVSESKKNQAVRQSVNPPQSMKKSRINTVISPFYGDVDHKQEIDKPKIIQSIVKADPFIEEVSSDMPKFKTENYSLDDLLSPIKPLDDDLIVDRSMSDEEDELAHQISLFDDLK